MAETDKNIVDLNKEDTSNLEPSEVMAKEVPTTEAAISTNQNDATTEVSSDETGGVKPSASMKAQKVGIEGTKPQQKELGSLKPGSVDQQLAEILAPTPFLQTLRNTLKSYEQELSNPNITEARKQDLLSKIELTTKVQANAESLHSTQLVASYMESYDTFTNTTSPLKGFDALNIGQYGDAAVESSKNRVDFLRGNEPVKPALQDQDMKPLLVGAAAELAASLGVMLGGGLNSDTAYTIGRMAPNVQTAINTSFLDIEKDRLLTNAAVTKAYQAAHAKWTTDVGAAMKDMSKVLTDTEKTRFDNWTKYQDLVQKDSNARAKLDLDARKSKVDLLFKAGDMSQKMYNDEIKKINDQAAMIQKDDANRIKAVSENNQGAYQAARIAGANDKLAVEQKKEENKMTKDSTADYKHLSDPFVAAEQALAEKKALKNPVGYAKGRKDNRTFANFLGAASNFTQRLSKEWDSKKPLSSDKKEQLIKLKQSLETQLKLVNKGRIFDYSTGNPSNDTILLNSFKVTEDVGSSDGVNNIIVKYPKGYEKYEKKITTFEQKTHASGAILGKISEIDRLLATDKFVTPVEAAAISGANK